MLKSGNIEDAGAVNSCRCLRFMCLTEADTESIAKGLAPRSAPGDTFLLSGPIGAGKSVFARAFIKTRLEPFAVCADVPSPTYTLVQTYDAGETEIWHADLYRLGSSQDIVELSLQDAFGSAICLIEWPDMLGPMRPAGATRIQLEYVRGYPDARRIQILPGNDRIRDALVGAGAESGGNC